jgi:hypothetical protein
MRCMTTVQITLPDDLAKSAAIAGLLAPDAAEAMFREKLRSTALAELRELLSRGEDDPEPPMTEEEIRAEIDAYRAKQRAAGR